jgi:hypothetical protein
MPGVEEYLRVYYFSSSPLRRSSYAWSGRISKSVLPQLLSPEEKLLCLEWKNI